MQARWSTSLVVMPTASPGTYELRSVTVVMTMSPGTHACGGTVVVGGDWAAAKAGCTTGAVVGTTGAGTVVVGNVDVEGNVVDGAGGATGGSLPADGNPERDEMWLVCGVATL